MIYWHDDNGRILQASSVDDVRSGFDEVPGVTRLHSPQEYDVNEYYVVGNSFRKRPAQPSPHHTFDYSTKAWVFDADEAWATVRRERSARLTASDWAVLRATNAGEPVPPEWLAYRQAPRDITAQPDPTKISWPVAPKK